MDEITDLILRRQGLLCLIPGCGERWTDRAHIWGRGMGGVSSLKDARHVIGLCHQHHMIFDGQELKGRQRLLRLLMESRRDLVEMEYESLVGSS